ncbi:MAG: ribosome recycling factor [Candidatus Hatepunaea meridiana]|nr:ribosome recycling factor [Candidatus Hatepunaea meridiana]
MIDIIKIESERMEKSVQHARDEMARIRTGKATPSLLDTVRVDYYGSPTPLNQLASINAPEPRLLVVLPYDKNLLGDVEKAILSGDLGLNPQNDGKVIRLPIPMLTSERREELIKLVKKLAEEGRVSIRNIRRDANEQIKKSEKAKEVSEDESHRLLDLTQKETNKYIEELDQILTAREEDIREE